MVEHRYVCARFLKLMNVYETVAPLLIPVGSPSCGGNVAIYVFNIKQLSLPTSFYSVLVSSSIFMALSPVFCSINSPNNSPHSRSVFLVLFLPYWSCQLYLFMKVSFSPDIILCG